MVMSSGKSSSPSRARCLIAALPARKNRQYNPFQFLLYRELEQHGFEAIEFESVWRHLHRVRLVHLHWPDGSVLVANRWRAAGRFVVFFGTLLILKLLGCPVVWTAHNVRSHDGYRPRMEQLFWACLYPLLDGIIGLQPHLSHDALLHQPAMRGTPFVHLPHPEYRSYYDACRETADTQVWDPEFMGNPCFLLFGQIRPYKRIPETIRAFASLRNPNARLVIAGQCFDPMLAQQIQALANLDKRIVLHLRFIEDHEVAGFFTAASALVLGQDSDKNSGVLILAGSYGLPIIRQPLTEADWAQRASVPAPPSWRASAACHTLFFRRLLSHASPYPQ